MALSPDKLIGGEEFRNFHENSLKEFPHAEVRMPITTLLHTYEYKPEENLVKVKAPVLILAAEKDSINPAGEADTLYQKAGNPKELFVIKVAAHFDVYQGEYFRQASGKAVEWFRKYL